MNRRRFLSRCCAAAGAGCFVNLSNLAFASASAGAGAAASSAATAGLRYRVGVCDWMILKRQKLGGFKLASDIGADGLELDMGGLGQRVTFDNKLADPAVRQAFLEEAKKNDVEICSISMSGFYAQSFPTRDGVDRIVQDTIDTMSATGVKVAFLPLGVQGDLVQHPELRPAVVERLRDAGRRAEKAGVVIGIETAYDAADEVKLLDDVGSPAVRSYFNFANPVQNGRDLHAELRTLGVDRICQIHASNQDGVWLENDPQIDVPAVKRTLDDMGWSGWLVIERSRDASDPRNVKRNFGANATYLKAVFQAG